MALHSSTLTWKIPWMEEPGRLQSMESLRVGHDWATSLSLFTFLHWRRKWQPTQVFLPGEFHGQRSLAGYRPWGGKESDTTEWLTLLLLSWSECKNLLFCFLSLLLSSTYSLHAQKKFHTQNCTRDFGFIHNNRIFFNLFFLWSDYL